MGVSFQEAMDVTGTNMEMVEDPRGRFRHTQVVAWLRHPNPDKIAPEKLLHEALDAVNRLVARRLTDSSIPPGVPRVSR